MAGTCTDDSGVARVLERLIGERGRPNAVRSDNGPEFTSRRMLGWAEDWKIELVHIQPGRLMQNGHVESFHARLCDECLNADWFRTLNDVRYTLSILCREYKTERPHSSLDYRTIAPRMNSARRLKGAGSWPCSLRKPQPSALRISSYEWLRFRGHVRRICSY